MSIEFARSYKTSDNQCHATLAEAQAHELELILGKLLDCDGITNPRLVSNALVESAKQVVDVLTMTECSRPKARNVKKPRKNRVTEPATTTAA